MYVFTNTYIVYFYNFERVSIIIMNIVYLNQISSYGNCVYIVHSLILMNNLSIGIVYFI